MSVGTPPDIVDTLYRLSAEALRDPAIKTKFDERGFEIYATTPAQFTELLKTEIPRLAEIIKARNIKPE